MEIQKKTIGIGLLILEVAMLISLFSFIPNEVFAAIGNPNANVQSWLNIGNVYPDIVNVSLNGGTTGFDNPIELSPNTTTKVWCAVVVRDYNGQADLVGVNATLYDSAYNTNSPDDNNTHYSNSSCVMNTDTGNFNGFADDQWNQIANCTFDVWYYANATNWVCNATAIDTMAWTDTRWDTEDISPLLALGVPDMINYSTVNATFVSDEQIANVTNLGNVEINLSLNGYARTPGDGFAMQCQYGNIQNISIDYEKYNVTASNPIDGDLLTLTQFEGNYTDLTSSAFIEKFNLPKRTNNLINDIFKGTYWRIYVPKGVAGVCNGTVVFGAVQAPAG